MNRLPMSKAAAGLLRALLNRVGTGRERVLLSNIRSTDWQSLTFVGERHELEFRLCGPEADMLLHKLTGGLEDADFALPGQIVADMAVWGEPERRDDGSILVRLEALTIFQ